MGRLQWAVMNRRAESVWPWPPERFLSHRQGGLMNLRPRFRPRLETLETRACPAVTASRFFGVLTVSGAATTPGDVIAVEQSAAGTFVVKDGAATVGTFTNINSVALKLTDADDKVDVNLGGQ